MIADSRHDLGLLHRIDAEVCLELEVGLDLVGVVAGLLAEHLDHLVERFAMREEVVAGDRCRVGAARCVGTEGAVRTNPVPRTGGPQLRQGVDERADVSPLGVVGVHRNVLSVSEDVCDERRLSSFGAHFDEDPRARLVHFLDERDELDGGRDLLAQQIANVVLDARARRVEVSRDVGEDRGVRRLDVNRREVSAERGARRGDDLRVEGVAHGERHDVVSGCFELRDRLFDGLGEPGDDRLLGAVLVGANYVAVDRRQNFLHRLDPEGDADHEAGIAVHRRGLRHLRAASGHGSQCFLERHHPGGHTRAVLAEAVPGDHCGFDAEAPKDAQDGDVGGEDGGLRYLGLRQREEDFGLVGAFGGAHDRGQRLIHDRRHDCVGFGEGLGDDRERCGEVPHHADVLGPLTGEEHRDLTVDRLFEQEDSVVRKDSPAFVLLERFGGFRQAFVEFLFGGERNRQADRSRGAGVRGVDEVAGPCVEIVGAERFELIRDCIDALAGEPEDARRRCGLGDGLWSRRHRKGGAARSDTAARARLGVVFFHHHVEVRPAEAERADARATRRAVGRVPRLGLGLQAERRPVEGEEGVRGLDVEGRR